METTILNEEKSLEYLNRGIGEVREWGKQMVGNVWNWFNLQNAIREYLDSIKYYPYHQQAWTNIAYVCHLIGKVDMAEKCMQRSLELAKPDHPGENYKKVEKAINNNSFLSGGKVVRPPLESWFTEKYEYFRGRLEEYLKNAPEKPPKPVKKILILSANPKTTPRLLLDKEVREIKEGLKRSKLRERFEIHSEWAVRIWDIRRALLDVEPQIVHFTGHGNEDGLLVEDELGLAVNIPVEALSDLFKLFSNQVECVVLNACYSETQAAAISQHIGYVIGMQKEIPDNAATEFAVGFYDALGAGRTVEDAFEFGCNGIRLFNIPDYLIPILKKRA